MQIHPSCPQFQVLITPEKHMALCDLSNIWFWVLYWSLSYKAGEDSQNSLAGVYDLSALGSGVWMSMTLDREARSTLHRAGSITIYPLRGGYVVFPKDAFLFSEEQWSKYFHTHTVVYPWWTGSAWRCKINEGWKQGVFLTVSWSCCCSKNAENSNIQSLELATLRPCQAGADGEGERPVGDSNPKHTGFI